MKLTINIPTDDEIMDYAAEHYPCPQNPNDIGCVLAHAKAAMIEARKAAALKAAGIEIEIV